MFKLFSKKTILDDDTVTWLFDSFEWALRNLDASVFFKETRLVCPDNNFFPGDAKTPDAKSKLILEQVKKHAIMEAWPVSLVDEDTYINNSFDQTVPKLRVAENVRGANALTPVLDKSEDALYVLHQPELLANPQALIANYAQMLANYLAYTVAEPPPGGRENWPLLTEVVAIYLGFGLMYANTSGNVRINSCASCQVPAANRLNYLSQYDAAYALAIFTKLKNIEFSDVKPYLKKTLHTFFKKALSELKTRESDMSRLRDYSS